MEYGICAVIISVIIKQYKPEFSIYISIIAGTAILLLIVDKISAIISLLINISDKTSISKSFIKLLIKITGIAILTEYAVSICKDSGEMAIASKIDIGGKVIIIAMSIPILSSLLETILNILP